MLLTETSTVYPLLHAGHIALVAGPAGLDLGDTDRDLTPAEVDQLSILLRLTPTQAVLLAQELFDCAAATLTIAQIEEIRAALAPYNKREDTPMSDGLAQSICAIPATLRYEYERLGGQDAITVIFDDARLGDEFRLVLPLVAARHVAAHVTAMLDNLDALRSQWNDKYGGTDD